MKSRLPHVRPGSRSAGATLVAGADYRDLLKRHEAVQGLVLKAAGDLAETERLICQLPPLEARRLELGLPAKRSFINMLEGRLAELKAELATFERQQAEILSKFPS